jgi:P27 family predicted phage terminase small subunit
MCQELEMLGVISLAERAAMLRYCHAYQQHHDFERQVKKDGRWQTNYKTGAITEHPASKAARDLANQMIKLLSAFGMTPTSRTRLAVKEKTEVDPDEKLFFG